MALIFLKCLDVQNKSVLFENQVARCCKSFPEDFDVHIVEMFFSTSACSSMSQAKLDDDDDIAIISVVRAKKPRLQLSLRVKEEPMDESVVRKALPECIRRPWEVLKDELADDWERCSRKPSRLMILDLV